jgi:glycerophosphoryl diester phosphodiesterase
MGTSVTDRFLSDYTILEIKQLRAKQAFTERPQQYKDQYASATFEEVVDLAKQKSK